MWWPLRRRARGRHAAGRVVFIGPSGPVEPWAPADLAVLQYAAAVLDEVPLSRPVEEQVAPTPPLAVVPAPPAPPAPPAVSLGFADGTSLELDAEHPAALAFRAVADRLVSASD